MHSPVVKERHLLRKIGINTLLCCLSLVLALGLVEVVLRFYNPLGFSMKGNKIVLPLNRTQIIYNQKGGRLDELVVNQKNSLGFRGEEPPADFGGRLTIVTVGGSTTECFALNEEKSWPYLLAGKLRNHFPKLWLDNAGLGGHSTFGHTILMQDYLSKIKPKTVLLMVGINDIGRDDLSLQDNNLKGIGYKKLENVLVSTAAHSEAAALFLNLYRFYFPVKIHNLGDIGEVDFRSLKYRDTPLSEEEEILEKQRRQYLPQYRGRLERLVNLAREHQIDPVLITQPVLYGQGVDDRTGVDLEKIDLWGTYNGRVGWRILELYNDVTRQTGRDQGLLVIDLAREMPKSSRYFYDLMHFANEGSEKVAAIISAHLLPYLAKKYPGYYQTISTNRH